MHLCCCFPLIWEPNVHKTWLSLGLIAPRLSDPGFASLSVHILAIRVQNSTAQQVFEKRLVLFLKFLMPFAISALDTN